MMYYVFLVSIGYNIPGISNALVLSLDVIAGIYSGSIVYWDDSAITDLNPFISLPHHEIFVFYQTEDEITYVLAKALSSVDNQFLKIGYGDDPNATFPIASSPRAIITGVDGMFTKFVLSFCLLITYVLIVFFVQSHVDYHKH